MMKKACSNILSFSKKVFTKNKTTIFWIIFIIMNLILFLFLPFVFEYIILKIFNFEGLLKIDLRKEYLNFYATILSGLFTVFGVILTINFENQQKKKENSITYKPIISIYGINDLVSGLRREAIFQCSYESSFFEENRNDKAQTFFDKQQNNMLKFNLVLKNRGRGETYNAVLGNLKIEDNYCNSHNLQCITCSEQYIGEILKDEFCIIQISLPSEIFVPKNVDDYCLTIMVPIVYSDMFNRVKYELIVHINCEVKVVSDLEPPYEKGDEYKFVSVFYEIGEIFPLMNIYSNKKKKFVHEEEFIRDNND